MRLGLVIVFETWREKVKERSICGEGHILVAASSALIPSSAAGCSGSSSSVVKHLSISSLGSPSCGVPHYHDGITISLFGCDFMRPPNISIFSSTYWDCWRKKKITLMNSFLCEFKKKKKFPEEVCNLELSSSFSDSSAPLWTVFVKIV